MESEARDRVMRAIDGPKRSRRGRGRGGWPIVIAIAAAAIGIALVSRRMSTNVPAGDQVARVVSAHRTTSEGAPLRRGPMAEKRIDVVEGGRLVVAFAHARATVEGPASVQRTGLGLALLEGAVRVEGKLAVQGAGCHAQIDGTTRAERFATHLRFRKTDGAVRFEEGAACVLE